MSCDVVVGLLVDGVCVGVLVLGVVCLFWFGCFVVFVVVVGFVLFVVVLGCVVWGVVWCGVVGGGWVWWAGGVKGGGRGQAGCRVGLGADGHVGRGARALGTAEPGEGAPARGPSQSPSSSERRGAGNAAVPKGGRCHQLLA